MRNLLLLATVLAAASPALAAPRLVATNVPDVTTVEAPPAGFDPLRATDADLDTYGFPPRPSKMQGEAYNRWVRIVSGAKIRIMPQLRMSDARHGPAIRVPFPPAAGNLAPSGVPLQQYSKNWSGVVIANGNSSFGAGSVTQISGYFNVSKAQSAFGACAIVRYATWVGIDGWNSSDVLQAGVEGDDYCVPGSNNVYYYAWYEWYPAGTMIISNLPISPGDIVTAYVSASSGTAGLILVENATTNKYVVMNVTAQSGTFLHGNSAEWILERPSLNNNLQTLANYALAYISDTGAAMGNTWFNYAGPPPGSTANSVQMVDSTGSVISASSQLWFNAIELKTEGSAK